MQTTVNKTGEKKASNSLVFKTSKVHGDEHIFVTISLDDQCKNGHQDFSITADIYEAGKPKTDRYYIAGGCCHEDILKAFPEFKQFVNLHLCDWEGVPMYAAENGFYHLQNGFNKTKPDSPQFKGEFCEYYRITPAQFEVLSTSKNQIQYTLNLQSLGILQQWKQDASRAIASLEQMTGQTFMVDNIRSQFNAPTPEQIKEEKERQKNGYYTPEAEQQRENKKQAALLAELEAERDKDIKKAVTEFEAKKQALIHGGEKALKNCIFYNHTNTLTFNWRSYDMISGELVEQIRQRSTLPKGVKIEDKKGK